MFKILYYFVFLNFCTCQNINNFFENINIETTKFNAIAAEITWESSINPAAELTSKTRQYQLSRILWQNSVCSRIKVLQQNHVLNLTQERQAYLLCRGPRYTFDETRKITDLYKELQGIYFDISVCVPKLEYKSKNNLTVIEGAILNTYLIDNRIHVPKIFNNYYVCLNGQEDFEKIIRETKNEKVLKWIWVKWRDNLLTMRRPIEELIRVENKAAIRNGYTDIGDAWQDDMEISDLQHFSLQLYKEFEPLYTLLHGVVRFYLRRQYGNDVPERGAIPAHLFGDICGQKWDHVMDIIAPGAIDLDDRIRKLNWSVNYMVNRVEDFYLSLGLPAMNEEFWRKSVFTKDNDDMTCHGAAADMFKNGDVRILYCADTTFEDFRVLHHEMGHIQYFLAYQNQPGLFRQANAALHESIGDAVMNGVITAQHLHRLRLLNDSELYSTAFEEVTQQNDISDEITQNKDVDDIQLNNEIKADENNDKETVEDNYDFTVKETLLLKQALNKLPQIPYYLAIEEFRLKYFKGIIDKRRVNDEFWSIIHDIQGIAPPIKRSEKYFDVGAEYHVPNNTPLGRYFLSSFLQHQIFESLCKGTVFGRRNANEDIPDTIMPSECDIYGSKTAGKILKDMMSRGNSQHWRKILEATIGEDAISTSALLRYYRPLHKTLTRLIEKYRIPIGW